MGAGVWKPFRAALRDLAGCDFCLAVELTAEQIARHVQPVGNLGNAFSFFPLCWFSLIWKNRLVELATKDRPSFRARSLYSSW